MSEIFIQFQEVLYVKHGNFIQEQYFCHFRTVKFKPKFSLKDIFFLFATF